MSRNPMSAVTRINKALAAAGRAERLVRGRGYYYLTGGDAANFPSSGIYAMWINPTERDYQFARSEVIQLFAAADIKLELPA